MSHVFNSRTCEMKDQNEIYKLIAKDLTSGLSEEEKNLLSEELLQLPDIMEKGNIAKEFWSKFFPPEQKHHIIARTEKKLGFTYGPRSKTKLNSILKIAAIILLVLSVGFSAYHLVKPRIILFSTNMPHHPVRSKKLY